jgi:CRISPR-associated endonuclease Csn1
MTTNREHDNLKMIRRGMGMMARIFGLDIGIGSCGWALLETETVDADTGEVAGPRVVTCGARCFEVPEEPDTKELKNKGRRAARGQRRVTRRRRQRLAEIRRLLRTEGLPLPGPMPPGTAADRVWRLRAEGLDRLLPGEEWARVLIHLARHRGFKSTSRRDRLDNKSDAGKALQGIAQLQQVAAGYRTVGEALALAASFARRKRNTTGDYSHTVLRQDIEDEARRLFAAQRARGNPQAGEELERRYAAIAFRQRPLSSSLTLLGKCRFEPAEYRAAKHAPSFELFRFLQTINHLRLSAPGAGARPLTPTERATALGLFATVQKPTYKKLRKELRLPDGTRFDGLAATKDPEAKTLADFTGSIKLMGALGEERFAALLRSEPEMLDAAMAAIVFQSTDEQAEAELRKAKLAEDDVAALMARIDDFAGLKGAGHVSTLACRRLLPHLREGASYSDACRLAGYDHTAIGAIDLDRLPNPVVRKVIGECLKQVRVLFRKYGLPDRVHVEMARDLGKSREDRLELYRAGQERGAERERHRGEFRDLLGRLPDDEELLRYELWQEQNHRCLYSNDYISPEQLVAADNSVQVDHILPYSRSGDDSYRNKVLVTARANQEKCDRTPWEAFGESDPARWQEFETRIDLLGSQLHREKRRKLLLKSFAEREGKYRDRHLQDTRYAVRVFRLLLEKHWPKLRTKAQEERRIFTQPGALTALVRRGLGLDEAKRSGALGDRDHALDALVIAWTDSGVVQRLTNEAKRLEREARARLVPELVADPAEKERLRRAFLAAAEAVFVSRPETRRGRGPAHGDTLHAFVANGDGSVTRFQKIPVTKLERKHLDRLKDPERPRPQGSGRGLAGRGGAARLQAGQAGALCRPASVADAGPTRAGGAGGAAPDGAVARADQGRDDGAPGRGRGPCRRRLDGAGRRVRQGRQALPGADLCLAGRRQGALARAAAPGDQGVRRGEGLVRDRPRSRIPVQSLPGLVRRGRTPRSERPARRATCGLLPVGRSHQRAHQLLARP